MRLIITYNIKEDLDICFCATGHILYCSNFRALYDFTLYQR